MTADAETSGKAALQVPTALLEQALAEIGAGRPDGARPLLLRAFGGAAGADPLAEPARLAALAEQLMVRLDWHEAFLLHEMLRLLGHRQWEWLRTRLAWRAEHRDEFRATFIDQPVMQRVAPHLAWALRRDVAAIRSQSLRPGFVGMALFRHDVAFADGGPPMRVVEKIMSTETRDRRRVNHEWLLFKHTPTDRLLAPAYFGSKEEGSFISTFAAFCEGRTLPLASWTATHDALMQRYWGIEPKAELLAGPNVAENYRQRLRDIIAGTVPDAVRDNLRHMTLRDASHALARRLGAIEDTIAAMPLFILHDDLHSENILVDADQRMTVIDWDNWALAPLGSGWRFYMTDNVPEIDIAPLREARTLPPGIMTRDLMLMAALWGFHKAIRRSEHPLAARWLERIVWFG
jgi:hypothetical protein